MDVLTYLNIVFVVIVSLRWDCVTVYCREQKALWWELRNKSVYSLCVWERWWSHPLHTVVPTQQRDRWNQLAGVQCCCEVDGFVWRGGLRGWIWMMGFAAASARGFLTRVSHSPWAGLRPSSDCPGQPESDWEMRNIRSTGSRDEG